MKFSANDVSFLLDDKPYYLYSGEIHYFRIPKKLWAEHLRKLKAANCQFVSTYIPWAWHEYEEGKFDFTGKTVPERDLEGFLKLAKKIGVYVTLKPGPWIIAEYINQGLPFWLTSNHSEICALTPQGINVHEFIITYMHPVFLKYIRKWYDKILPVIKKYQISNGGTVGMMQVCNEVGLNQWLGGLGDYSPVTMKYYRDYLKNKYKSISRMNKILGSNFPSFEEAQAPSGIAFNKLHYNLYREWHLFHRWYYSLYLDWIINEVKGHDIDVQLYHNVPGWVYSRAKDFPLNITMYNDVFKKHKDVVFGVDHIPENTSYRNFHDDLPCNEILKAMRFRKGPIFAAEFQAGSREFCVRTYPRELELFYKASFANGLFGMNFYMFSQGKNYKKMGHYGPTFYWDTALDSDGKKEPLYPAIQDIGKWLNSNGKLLLESERKSTLAVGFYSPYYETEFTHPFGGNFMFDAFGVGLKYDTKPTRDQLFFDGLMKAIQMLNYDMDVYDLQKADVEELLSYKQLCLFSLEYMDEEVQKKIVEYVKRGGRLILFPTVPRFDLNLNPCTILKDALKIVEKASFTPSAPKISFLKYEELYVFSRINEYKKGPHKVIAKNFPSGQPCGMEIKHGKGKVLFMGTGFTNVIKEHMDAWEKVFNYFGNEKNAYSDNDELRVIERFGEDYAYLFVLNFHNMAHTGKIFYKDPVTGAKRALSGKISLSPMAALMLPVNLPLPKEKGRIISSTVEILNVTLNSDGLIMEVKGNPGSQSEIHLKLSGKPRKVKYDGNKSVMTYKGGKLSVKFECAEGVNKLKVHL